MAIATLCHNIPRHTFMTLFEIPPPCAVLTYGSGEIRVHYDNGKITGSDLFRSEEAAKAALVKFKFTHPDATVRIDDYLEGD